MTAALLTKSDTKYHKIQTLYKRDMDSKKKELMEGEWTKPEFFYLKDNYWSFSEKVDGTNIRLIFDGETGNIAMGGRTDNAQLPGQLVLNLQQTVADPDRLFYEVFGDSSATIYGEGYGGKIQKGGGNYGLDQKFVVFDVRVGNVWLDRDSVRDVAEKLGLTTVPEIGGGSLQDCVRIVKDGLKSCWGDFTAEGIVARPGVDLVDRFGNRIIAKIKHRDFFKGGES